MSLEGHQFGRYRLQHPLGSGGMGKSTWHRISPSTAKSLSRSSEPKPPLILRRRQPKKPLASSSASCAPLPRSITRISCPCLTMGKRALAEPPSPIW